MLIGAAICSRAAKRLSLQLLWAASLTGTHCDREVANKRDMEEALPKASAANGRHKTADLLADPVTTSITSKA